MEFKADDNLVLRVNELYHDLENKQYASIHPEIFYQECQRWQDVGSFYIRVLNKKISVLDIGCGTGFVCQQLAGFLKKEDEVVCADISEEMLRVCKESLESVDLSAKVNYAKLDGKKLPFSDMQFDVVTMNSTLHHIPDTSGFLAEVDRVLKPQGLMIVGHEPNSAHYRSGSIRFIKQSLGSLLCPRRTFGGFFRKLGIVDLVRSILKKISSRFNSYGEIVNELNNLLMEEGLIDKHLKWDQITMLVDIHSPSAGGTHLERGFSPETLKTDHLESYKILQSETYNHLDDITHSNKLTIWVASKLKKRYPSYGATFTAVYEKV